MEKFNIGIYQIINLINGKRYIGSSSNIKKRRNSHFRNLFINNHNNKYLQNSYNKNGKENFKFEIIMHCRIEDLIFFEQIHIDKYEFKTLYNIRKIAESNRGLIASEETRRKLRKRNNGRKMSKEVREKISKAHTGKKLSEKTKKKLSIINTGENHPKYGVPHSIETCKKIGDSHRGEKCYLYGVKGWDNRSSIPIYQLNIKSNEIIKMWASAAQASQELKINRSHITAVCRGRRKKAGNFYWKYVEFPVK